MAGRCPWLVGHPRCPSSRSEVRNVPPEPFQLNGYFFFFQHKINFLNFRMRGELFPQNTNLWMWVSAQHRFYVLGKRTGLLERKSGMRAVRWDPGERASSSDIAAICWV